MKLGLQFGGWLRGLGLSAALALPCAAAQLPPKDRPPRSEARAERQEARREHQAETRRNDRPPNANRAENTQRFRGNENRSAAAPSPNPQERFRSMTPLEKQRLAQNEERLRHLPPAQQQRLKERAQVWQKMTPEQRDHVRNDVLPRWRQMPPDRKQAIQQRLRVLQNMPEYARNQRLNDPNFTRGMSEEDRSTLHDLSHLHVGGAPEPPNE
jgi:hypothetical protein